MSHLGMSIESLYAAAHDFGARPRRTRRRDPRRTGPSEPLQQPVVHIYALASAVGFEPADEAEVAD